MESFWNIEDFTTNIWKVDQQLHILDMLTREGLPSHLTNEARLETKTRLLLMQARLEKMISNTQ